MENAQKGIDHNGGIISNIHMDASMGNYKGEKIRNSVITFEYIAAYIICWMYEKYYILKI